MIARRKGLLFKQSLKDHSRLLTVIHQGVILPAVQPHVPMVRTDHGQEPSLPRERHHVAHLITIDLTDDAG